jgi:hypothetical protein
LHVVVEQDAVKAMSLHVPTTKVKFAAAAAVQRHLRDRILPGQTWHTRTFPENTQAGAPSSPAPCSTCMRELDTPPMTCSIVRGQHAACVSLAVWQLCSFVPGRCHKYGGVFWSRLHTNQPMTNAAAGGMSIGAPHRPAGPMAAGHQSPWRTLTHELVAAVADPLSEATPRVLHQSG